MPGLGDTPAAFDRGPLALRGDVQMLSGSRFVTVVGGGGGLPVIADDSLLTNISGAPAAPTEQLLTDLAGSGLQYDDGLHQLEIVDGAANSVFGRAVGSAGIMGSIPASTHSALIRSDGNLFFASAAEGQTLRRPVGGVLGFGDPLAATWAQVLEAGNLSGNAGNHPTIEASDELRFGTGTLPTGGSILAATDLALFQIHSAGAVGLSLFADLGSVFIESVAGNVQTTSDGDTIVQADGADGLKVQSAGGGGIITVVERPDMTFTPNAGELKMWVANSAPNRMRVTDDSDTENTLAYLTDIPSASASIVLNSGSFERAALTGDVTAGQNSNAATIANNAVSNAKLADMSAHTIKAQDASAGDPLDVAIAVNSIVSRAGGNIGGLAVPSNGAAFRAGTANLNTATAAEGTVFQRLAGGNLGFSALQTSGLLAVHTRFQQDASYSVTPPAGATWFEVEAVGAGGGGGGADSDSNGEANAGGGGGAGAYIRLLVPVTTGNITGAVGAGGAGGSNTGGTGGTGGATTFGYDGTNASAPGGAGGVGRNSTNNSATTMRIADGGLGGTAPGAPPYVHENGGDGHNGIMYTNGTTVANAAASGGNGGASFFGGGGRGGTVHAGSGTEIGSPGNASGSGGGGAARISTGSSVGAVGGQGVSGALIIRFYSGPVPTVTVIP